MHFSIVGNFMIKITQLTAILKLFSRSKSPSCSSLWYYRQCHFQLPKMLKDLSLSYTELPNFFLLFVWPERSISCIFAGHNSTGEHLSVVFSSTGRDSIPCPYSLRPIRSNFFSISTKILRCQTLKYFLNKVD